MGWALGRRGGCGTGTVFNSPRNAHANAVQQGLAEGQISTLFIPPGHPWDNGFIESFHDKFRDECLQHEWFVTIPEAQVVVEAWRIEYNTVHPHSALHYQTLAAFATEYQKQKAASLIPNGHKK